MLESGASISSSNEMDLGPYLYMLNVPFYVQTSSD